MQLNIAILAAAGLIASAAGAQTRPGPVTTPSSSTTAAASKSAKAPVVRTAKSLECSKQADTKGLHGKPRKSFMSRCKKA